MGPDKTIITIEIDGSPDQQAINKLAETSMSGDGISIDGLIATFPDGKVRFERVIMTEIKQSRDVKQLHGGLGPNPVARAFGGFLTEIKLSV